MIFDPMYFLFLAPAMLLSAWAAFATRSRFAKYAQVPNHRRVSGAQAARFILDRNGLHHVQVVPVEGDLSDHYDPRTAVVRLSEDVYYGGSVSSLAIAAHETGHAIQHAQRYLPLAIRNAAIPVANIGSSFGWILIFGGMMLSMASMIWAGVILFSATVLFQVVTLPIELDASRRAKTELERLAIVSPSERPAVSKVLRAAAMTYIGAALTGMLTLAYFVFRSGLLAPRRE
jgi:Zn-dependent membrane protease YugP